MDMRSDTPRQDKKHTHPRDDHGETIERERTCDEDSRRTHAEQSAEDGNTREREERTTENEMERRVPTRHDKIQDRDGRSSVVPYPI